MLLDEANTSLVKPKGKGPLKRVGWDPVWCLSSIPYTLSSSLRSLSVLSIMFKVSAACYSGLSFFLSSICSFYYSMLHKLLLLAWVGNVSGPCNKRSNLLCVGVQKKVEKSLPLAYFCLPKVPLNKCFMFLLDSLSCWRSHDFQ